MGKIKWRRLAIVLHRDLGYFFTGVVVIYSISGLAVNHVGQWDPDFIIDRREVLLQLPAERKLVNRDLVLSELSAVDDLGEFRSFDFPSDGRIKIYLDDGSIVAKLGDPVAEYETVRRRPVLFEFNRLHLNPKGWWRIFSDVFAVCLIVIAGTGLFVLRGRNGITGRGKWLVSAGVIVPLLALVLSI